MMNTVKKMHQLSSCNPILKHVSMISKRLLSSSSSPSPSSSSPSSSSPSSSSPSSSTHPFFFGKLEVSHKGAVADYYNALIVDKYSIGNAPNGGYIMSLAIESMRNSLSDEYHDPFSISAYYINKAEENVMASFEVRIINKTKSGAQIQCNMIQNNIIRVSFLGLLGSFDHRNNNCILNKLITEKNTVISSPIEECVNANEVIRKVYGDKLRIANEYELYLPKTCEFFKSTLKNKDSNIATIEGYCKFKDESVHLPCIKTVPFFLDALPPPILNMHKVEWIPTLELTVHFWDKLPTTITKNDWLQVKFQTNHVEGSGYLYEDGECWFDDKLIAKSRQLARILKKR